jgi:hypothetical protein
MLKPNNNQSSGCTHIHQTKVGTNVCQNADGNCFPGEEGTADGGIHATRDHSNVRSAKEKKKKEKKKNNNNNQPTNQQLCRAIQNKRCEMLTSGVRAVFLHDNMHPHTAAHTRALLEHFNCELFDHLPHSPDLAPSHYSLFTYLKNLLGPQHFNNNELMEGVKTWLSSQAEDIFETSIQNLIPQYDKCLNISSDYTEK